MARGNRYDRLARLQVLQAFTLPGMQVVPPMPPDPDPDEVVRRKACHCVGACMHGCPSCRPTHGAHAPQYAFNKWLATAMKDISQADYNKFSTEH